MNTIIAFDLLSSLFPKNTKKSFYLDGEVWNQGEKEDEDVTRCIRGESHLQRQEF